MIGTPRARIAVVSMHTSPTAALGHSANGGMNVYIREVCAAFSRCAANSSWDIQQRYAAPLSTSRRAMSAWRAQNCDW